MPDKSYSGRERLRNLIDGDALAVKQAKRQRSVLGMSSLAYRFRVFSENVKKTLSWKKKDTSVATARVVFVITILAIVVISIVGIILLVQSYLSAVKKPEMPAPQRQVSAQGPISAPLAPLSTYMNSIKDKNVFDQNRLNTQESTQEVQEIVAPLDDDMIYRLVGIDWSESPIALIEDVRTGRTHFVKKDDTIKDLKIIEIVKNKVKASMGDKIIEIR